MNHQYMTRTRKELRSPASSAAHLQRSNDRLETSNDILRLQEVVGNRGLQRLLAEGQLQREAAPAASHARTGPRPDLEDRFGIGRSGGGLFDATLDRRIGWLTLKMKVKFNFVNTPEAWPSPAEQNQWQDRFIERVTNRWSFRHFLVPDQPCPEEPHQRIVSRIQVIPVTSSPHYTVTVGYTSTNRTSSVNRTRHTGRLDSRDTAPRERTRDGDTYSQVPAEHEFGHMLGLPHVHCDTNDRSCYGTDSEEMNNIMGIGSIVSAEDYRIFAEAMYYFSGTNWQVE